MASSQFLMEMDETRVREMNELMRVLGIKDMKKLINAGLTLLKRITEKQQEGYKLVLINLAKEEYIDFEP